MTHSRVAFSIAMVAGFALILGFQNCAKDPEGLPSSTPRSTGSPSPDPSTDPDPNTDPGTNPSPSPSPVAGAATIQSVSLTVNGASVMNGGFYDSTAATATASVVASNATNGVLWGPQQMTKGAAAGSAFNYTLTVGLGTPTYMGFYGELDVVAKGGTTAQNTSTRLASHCLASSHDCKLMAMTAADSARPRAVGPFLSNRTAANCGAGVNQASDGPASRNTFNNTNIEECIVFYASPGGQANQQIKCYYVGVDSPNAAQTAFYNTNHEVPCNGGMQLKYIGHPGTADTNVPGPANGTFYAAYFAVNVQTKLANKVVFQSVCSNGTCTISPVKTAYYSQTCQIPTSTATVVSCN